MAGILQTHNPVFHSLPLRTQKDAPSATAHHASSYTSTSVALGFQPSNISNQTPTFHPNMSASASHPAIGPRAPKRRMEEDENDYRTGRDVAMDRSPTPERPKRAVPKRARTAPHANGNADSGKDSKEGKMSSKDDDADVDVGLLLGTEEPHTSLISANLLFLCSKPAVGCVAAVTQFPAYLSTDTEAPRSLPDTSAYSCNCLAIDQYICKKTPRRVSIL
jgi:hypothetical protein